MATVRARAPSDRAVERFLPTALVEHAAIVFTVTATTAPTLIAYNLPPSPTQLNQLAALALWGCAAVALAMATKGRASYAYGVLGSLSSGLAWSGACIVAATAVVVVLGALSSSQTSILQALCLGGVLVGTASAAIACIQVFAPTLADGEWIARSSFAGRAVGNVR